MQNIVSKRCCFAGHSKIYNIDDVYKNLLILTEKLIKEENVKEFWVGNYGNFDSISAKAVRSLKEKYTDIELNLVIPYLTKDINENRELYYRNFDSILMADFPEKTPKKFQILKCNEYMGDKSDYIICYVEHGWGGAAKTLEYARKTDVKIYNIAHTKLS